MPLQQFINTLGQILHNDGVIPFYGLYRHLFWQMRKRGNWFPVELMISNSRMLIDQPTGVAALVNCLGMYDFNNMNLIKTILKDTGGTFIDIGANIGTYTLVASEIAEAYVVSCEPHPTTYARLVRNIRLNKRTNVLPLNIALSSENQFIFLTDESDPSINRIRENATLVKGVLQVQGKTLDTLCKALQLQPTIVKIDVEGHEAQVLDGFQEYVGIAQLLLIEHGEQPLIRSWMRERGFIGPYYFSFAKKSFCLQPQRRPEDAVYIRQPFTQYLAASRLIICPDQRVV